ncbi:translin family protein [Aspergillus saccharolyticus JOP 1030-1]|uniref:Translin-associated factor TraX n=1 Tax=Aspergillus saccharolyticus JOP 1030-1 TaxID=1450539 RepID=A0A318Z8H7_9EURO|nr:translin-associated factor TraX [Aspergillus saccharolyticus JOP 1030-1]PYH43641.1 translin-associated factor TraX [Aspergillus saccharolyticus JOP 1030-1]
MAGTKRTWEGQQLPTRTPDSPFNMDTEATSATTPPSIQSMFKTFRNELDEHHDRRERLIKTSRDITALSKKIIFSLQRVRNTPGTPLPPSIATEINPRFTQITSLFESTLPDLQTINQHRYQRQLSGAIQEFIEALSFRHYLTTQTLITMAEIRAHLPDGILLTEEDYLMGVFDLTGEMMRFAVTGLSATTTTTAAAAAAAAASSSASGDDGQDAGNGDGDGDKGSASKAVQKKRVFLRPEQNALVVDLRAMRAAIELLSIPRRHAGSMFRDLGRKTEVMQGSVEKVERAAYGILVRGSERPEGWRPDLSSAGGPEGEVY